VVVLELQRFLRLKSQVILILGPLTILAVVLEHKVLALLVDFLTPVVPVVAGHIPTHLVFQVALVHLLVTQLTLLFNILTLFVQLKINDY
jgi:hypothetical protein